MSATFVGQGRLGKNPEMKFSPKGTAITNFSIAVNSGYGDKKKTFWVNVSAFGSQAELMNQWLKKGSWVSINGEITDVRGYTKKDETVGVSLDVRLLTIDFLGDVNSKEDVGSEPEEF